MYQPDFGIVLANWNVLARGLWATLALAALAIAGGFALGLVLAAARMAPTRWVAWPARLVIELFRNTPVLVQILWFFFALPILTGQSLSPLTAAALAIGLNSAAFTAEIYRAGLQSIGRGQWDAARAVGMSPAQAFRRIILPQALRRVLPALTNRAIEVTKMTSLASAIAVAELLHQGRLLSSATFRPMEVFTAVAAIYFLLLFPLTRLALLVERRVRAT